LQILNPPDSDASEDSDLTDAEFIEAVLESTCINTIDQLGEPAIAMMMEQPKFTILRNGTITSLVLFQDRSFRVFRSCDVDEAHHRLWVSAHPNYSIHHDKFEAAAAQQSSSNDNTSPAGWPYGAESERSSQNGEETKTDAISGKNHSKILAMVKSESTTLSEQLQVPVENPTAKKHSFFGKWLSVKTLRRILSFKETIHKYGVFVPRNDREAEISPEAIRWDSGRKLEWIRLQEQGTFERNWDWPRVKKMFPQYRKQDVGHVFFVYDYKHSGEHRVRLVFDGSRQNPETYTETYAPTARGESVRLFHVYAVEEAWTISQFDVPQAFLKSKIDCDIFVYPPKNFEEFTGQLLKLRLSLYGAKQSAALWNNLIDTFLRGLGFSPSPMDPCLYRREDSIIILFCDDLRVAGSAKTVSEIQAALYAEYKITTSDGTRFLGMDTTYDMKRGYLKLHMATYIESTYERFRAFDISLGVPFREIIGCLLWICLCVMGPELLRVKDLARRSNVFTKTDYDEALKVLEKIFEKRNFGIVFLRGGAGNEVVPSNSRNGIVISENSVHVETGDNTGSSQSVFNELKEKALYKVKDEIAAEDIRPIVLPLNSRYQLTIYADASFAVGELKQSVSGYVIFLNGTPLLWGSLKQTVVVDSSCSAEYVAASIACKQAIHAENIIQFLGFSCIKPYTMYTDSIACLGIATNSERLGNVRHLSIRYNLIRCYVTLGEITMIYCVTEDMIADLLTKIVSGSQDTRLAIRFYNLCPSAWDYVTGI
jgi:hypothetical protein